MSDNLQHEHRYPFETPCLPRPPSRRGRCSVVLIGAYPSAFHARWYPPAPFNDGLKLGYVQAIPIGDEPTPFWNGSTPDADDVMRDWMRRADARWGRFEASGNGSSGKLIEQLVLEPLALRREEVCITDCLDTYRESGGDLRARLDRHYRPLARSLGLEVDALAPHPDEDQIVTEALRDHSGRLLDELREASPSLVITVGNAPLRVLRELVARDDPSAPSSLCPDDVYGREVLVPFEGRQVRWLPLAHPRALRSRPRYRRAHDAWMGRMPKHAPAPR